jgi:hypothetical protein
MYRNFEGTSKERIPYKLVRVGLNLTENSWRCKAQSALKLYFAWQKQRSARVIKLDPNPLSPIYTVTQPDLRH